MSITLNKSKTIHPNRLVTRHEEFLVNKNLANKVIHVKSTIKAGNKHYEDILNRRKKEQGRHSHSHLNNVDNYAPDFSNPIADDLRIKTSDAQTRNGRMMDPYFLPAARKLHSSTERKAFETFVGSPNTSLANSKQSTMTNLHRYNSPKYLNYVEAEKSPDIGSEKGLGKNDDFLNQKLIEKSKEIEYLKNELKEWWHEDFKELKSIEKKPTVGEKLAPIQDAKPATKTLRKTFSLKEEFSRGENNNLALNVPQTTTSNNPDRIVKNKEDFIIKKTHVTFSTANSKSKSSSEDKKGVQDKLKETEGKRIPVKTILKRMEMKERPSTVKNESQNKNEEFKVRLSHNAATMNSARNQRYISITLGNHRYIDNPEFEQIAEVEEDNTDSNVFSSKDINDLKEMKDSKGSKKSLSSSKKSNSKFFSASHENIKTDFQEYINNMQKDDSVVIGEASPQIYPTSKTLARQSKDQAIARKERDLQMSEEMIQFGSVNFNNDNRESLQDATELPVEENNSGFNFNYHKISDSMQVSDVRIE